MKLEEQAHSSFHSRHLKCKNCSALEQLEDKIDELDTLDLDEAIKSKEDHTYSLAWLYQILFSTWCALITMNSCNYRTEPVLRRLANSDHATLIRARPFRGYIAGCFQMIHLLDRFY